MRVVRFAIALLVTPLLLALQPEAAAAAPPSNDTFAGATPVTLGFSEELDDQRRHDRHRRCPAEHLWRARY